MTDSKGFNMITLQISKTKENAFSSINEALKSIKDSTEPITLYIDSGTYEEKVYLRRNNVRIIGESPQNTIITYNHGAKSNGPNGKPMGTFNSFTMIFCGSDICVENLTIKNTSGPGSINGQAVAAFITSDRTSFYNCHFIGYQDTIYSGLMTEEFFNRIFAPDWFLDSRVNVFHQQGQNYFENCYVEGDVDYIFGSNLAYFNNCHIHTLHLQSEGEEAYITAANTPVGSDYGFIFTDCKITGEDQEGVYLGRPWRDYAKTIFCRCHLDTSIHPFGWHNWNRIKAELTTQFVEISNDGPGASKKGRISFSKQLIGTNYIEMLQVNEILDDFSQWIKPIKQTTL
jgi:pectinesterase